MQDADGAVQNAVSSITNSRGQNLILETTALSAMAWLFILPAETMVETTLAVQYISINMVGGGRYGSTQATMLSLQLIIEFFNLNGGKVSQGELVLSVDDAIVISVELSRHEGYVIDYSDGLNDYFKENFPGSEVAGRTIDFDLNIVDLPSDPNKYSIGASFYARYWDRNPPNVLSDNIALTVDRSP